jgi:hypothetical protein
MIWFWSSFFEQVSTDLALLCLLEKANICDGMQCTCGKRIQKFSPVLQPPWQIFSELSKTLIDPAHAAGGMCSRHTSMYVKLCSCHPVKQLKSMSTVVYATRPEQVLFTSNMRCPFCTWALGVCMQALLVSSNDVSLSQALT